MTKRETTKRRRHSAEFKAKVVLAALRCDKTHAQLANEFGVHPLMITGWKKQLLDGLPEVFGGRARERTEEEQSELERPLYERIGRLETELTWLKTNLNLSPDVRRSLVAHDDAASIRRIRSAV